MYSKSTDAVHRRVLSKFTAPTSEGGLGMAKYDGDHPHLDSGVLAIRDFLLGVGAGQYASCGSKRTGFSASLDCQKCTWPSRFVAGVLKARGAEGRGGVDAFSGARIVRT